MNFKNSEKDYGIVSIFLHWLVAFTVIGLFAVGYWMVGLSYYDELYRTVPFVHKSVGVLLFIVMIFRMFWRFYSKPPKAESSLKKHEKKAAHAVHFILYALIFVIMISGYLISTADGRSVDVFNWFSVPATFVGLQNQAYIVGQVHWYAALALIIFVGLHALGAFKHHFIEGDHTLKKMLGIKRKDG